MSHGAEDAGFGEDGLMHLLDKVCVSLTLGISVIAYFSYFLGHDDRTLYLSLITVLWAIAMIGMSIAESLER